MKKLLLALMILSVVGVLYVQHAVPVLKCGMPLNAEHMTCDFEIMQVAPNSICFKITRECVASIEIYNVLGQKVRVLANELFPEGFNIIDWDGLDDHGREADGSIYFCRLKTAYCENTKKIILLK